MTSARKKKAEALLSRRIQEHPATDKVILLLVSGMSERDIADAATGKLGIAHADVPAILAEARRRITLAADYHRDEQIGTAITRLNDVYGRSIRDADNKTALQAQRELNRLLDLTPTPGPDTYDDDRPGTHADAELAAIRAHLAPLALAPADYPLREHARVAAEKIRDAQAANPKPEPTL